MMVAGACENTSGTSRGKRAKKRREPLILKIHGEVEEHVKATVFCLNNVK
jgi:hypothetical protein